MKLKNLFGFLAFLPSFAFASYHFEVTHAPYQALIEVETCDFTKSVSNSGRCDGKGTVTLKKPNWQQTFTSDDLIFYTDKNKKPSQTMALYDEESPLILGDFNFDGSLDIAIRNGSWSGYSGPSYDVYVFAKNSQKFIKSDELTSLASEHLGMFTVNKKHKYLEIMDKSGAGWHQISRYAVIPNKPLKLIYVWTEDYSATGEVEVTTEVLTKTGWKKTTQKFDSEKYTAE